MQVYLLNFESFRAVRIFQVKTCLPMNTDEQQCVRLEVSYLIVMLVNNETRPVAPLAVPYGM
jgi:hypothetical protein